MQSQSMLKDLLLISNPKVIGLCNYLNQTAILFILPAFYIAIALEFFNKFEFEGVAKRAFIAFLAIKILGGIHVDAVNMSLETSSTLVSKYSPQNKFLSAYEIAKGDTASENKKGVWTKLTSIVKVLAEDPITMVIFLVSYFSFFLLTQLYSLTYHLTIAMIGLCAVLSIFPIMSGSLKGAVKSMLWCTLMPFVVAVILCLIGDSDVFFKTYTGAGIVQNLESLIQLLILMVILLLSPLITSKLMSESGVSHVAENLGQMAGMATLIGGASSISKFLGNRAMNVATAAHNNTTRPLMNSIKSNLSNKAHSIAKNKGISHSVSTVSKSSPIDKIKGKLSDAKENGKNTTFKEKMVLGADSVINRKENALAKKAMATDLNQFPPESRVRKGLISPNGKIPVANYKQQAGEYFRQRDELINRPKISNEFERFRNQTPQISQSKNSYIKNEKSNLTKGGTNAGKETIFKVQNQRRSSESNRFRYV